MSVAYPAGTVFLDANVFLHNVFAHRRYQAYCRTLLRKVEAGEIAGVTSVLVLDEVLFRMLIAETARTFSVPFRQAHQFLKDHPDKVADAEAILGRHRQDQLHASPAHPGCDTSRFPEKPGPGPAARAVAPRCFSPDGDAARGNHSPRHHRRRPRPCDWPPGVQARAASLSGFLVRETLLRRGGDVLSSPPCFRASRH